MTSDKEAIIFFDGICNLCNGAVQFVLKRDKMQYYKFASLQSDKTSQLLSAFKFDPTQLESIVIFDNGVLFKKSDAILKISGHLSGLWPAFQIFRIIPKPIRDWVYDWIAGNRYKWFGKKDQCMVPTPELQSRFV